MNREIKYRYWYGGKMLEVGQIDFFTDGTYRVNDELIGGILLQYTGLKDKNGKDVYEGDIMKDVSKDHSILGEVCKVIYVAPQFQLLDKKERGFTLFHHGSYEIIGNIYQDSHLLETKN